MKLNLTQRLMAVFTVLLIACCMGLAWLHLHQARNGELQLTQRLSYRLAQHIADNSELIGDRGLAPAGLNKLLNMLMVVNPSIEVYLLDAQGGIVAHLAPPGRVMLKRVSLDPIQRYLTGRSFPILGDDPRHPERPNVFSAAPLKRGGRVEGYVYVVLLGEDHEALAARGDAQHALVFMLGSMSLVLLMGILAGVAAFSWVTKPLRDLTSAVQALEEEGVSGFVRLAGGAPDPDQPAPADEIGQLRNAFHRMANRLAMQWQELLNKDQQRRELVANISHDLRTPLTALHGYLETLALKDDSLSVHDRRKYLRTALAQSRKVGQLAQELFELARLEYGGIRLEKERFQLVDLIQDVFEKFELATQARGVRLAADFQQNLPSIEADVALIERVLTNLLDNAVRHSPDGGAIRVAVSCQHSQVWVEVSDDGTGVPGSLRGDLFERPSVFSASAQQPRGGLGLLIVKRIMQLHDGDVELIDSVSATGATFRFVLPTV